MRLLIIDHESTTSAIQEALSKKDCTETGNSVSYNISHIPVKEGEINKNSATILEACKEFYLNNEPGIILSSLHYILNPSIASFIEHNPTGGILILSAGFTIPHLAQTFSDNEPLSLLIAQGKLSPQQVILFGLRGQNQEEHHFLRDLGIKRYYMNTIAEEGILEITLAAMEELRKFSSTLIILNLNVIDPAFAPDCKNTVPGGLTPRELLFCLSKILLLPTITSIHIWGYTTDMEAPTKAILAHTCIEIIGSLGSKSQLSIKQF